MTQNIPDKFLIIGATGLIGERLVKEMSPQQSWLGTSYKTENKRFVKMDITDSKSVEEVISKFRPTIVILCANLSGGVEFCEKNPDIARKWHYEGTLNVGKMCDVYKSKFLYISSECVFDGKKEVYEEADHVNPLNVYGEQKVKSEQWIRKNLSQYMIVRTMSVFGWQLETKAPNALMKAYFAVSKKEKISVPVYRWGTPTYVGDLALALIELSTSKTNGIFHVVGSSYLNRYDWLKKSCEALGWDASGMVMDKEVPKVSARYPLKIRLENKKFRASFKTPLSSLDEALILLKKDILSQNNKIFLNEQNDG